LPCNTRVIQSQDHDVAEPVRHHEFHRGDARKLALVAGCAAVGPQAEIAVHPQEKAATRVLVRREEQHQRNDDQAGEMRKGILEPADPDQRAAQKPKPGGGQFAGLEAAPDRAEAKRSYAKIDGGQRGRFLDAVHQHGNGVGNGFPQPDQRECEEPDPR
jgi:hypothetical protein